MANTKVTYKMVVLGDGAVGKTALTLQLCFNYFMEEYDPTIEDSYRKQVQIDGQSCVLDILDTAGQREYTALIDSYIRTGECFMIVYSVLSKSSFTRAQLLYTQIRQIKKSARSSSAAPEPVVLVANKCDETTEREVSTQEGQALASRLSCPFIETSAKDSINVEKSFYDIVRRVRSQRYNENGIPAVRRPAVIRYKERRTRENAFKYPLSAVTNAFRPVEPVRHIKERATPYFDILKSIAQRYGLIEPAIKPGQQRIRWVCSCGTNLYDDFIEFEDGALGNLATALSSGTSLRDVKAIFSCHFWELEVDDLALALNIRTSMPGVPRTTNSVAFRLTYGLAVLLSFPRLLARAVLGSAQQSDDLPLSTTSAATAVPRAQTTDKHEYLLFCVDDGTYGVKLNHEILRGVSNDRALFVHIRRVYGRLQTLKSRLSFRTVRSIQLTKFHVDVSAFANVEAHDKACTSSMCSCLPPANIVEPEPNADYRCTPIPSPYSPPIGPRYLMHYMQSPTCINPSQTRVLEQMPKRISGELLAAHNNQVPGWGVHFQEGLNLGRIWVLFAGVFVLGGLAFGVTWTVLKHDAQTAFTIAATWMSTASVILACLVLRNV